MMRILFIQDLGWFIWGGGLKLNRMVAHQLAERGHDCHAVVLHRDFLEIAHDLASVDDVTIQARDEKEWRLDDGGVGVHVCFELDAFEAAVHQVIETFDPHCIVFNTGESGYGRLAVLPAAVLERTVASALVQESLPFGPLSAQPEPRWAARFAKLGGAVAMNRRMQDYIRRWGPLESEVLYFPAYGEGPFPVLGRHDRGYVTLINVSPLKGLALFIELARAMRDVEFAAVPTWGTVDAALDLLQSESNVTVLEPRENFEEILDQTRVLLVPSLWQEAFGLVVVEAMLHGIPVLASEVGGLPESTLGVDCVLPVRPIENWRRQPGQRLHTCTIPDQDIGPWQERLRTLLTDRHAYESLARVSRQAALDHVAATTVEPFEHYFESVAKRAGTLTE